MKKNIINFLPLDVFYTMIRNIPASFIKMRDVDSVNGKHIQLDHYLRTTLKRTYLERYNINNNIDYKSLPIGLGREFGKYSIKTSFLQNSNFLIKIPSNSNTRWIKSPYNPETGLNIYSTSVQVPKTLCDFIRQNPVSLSIQPSNKIPNKTISNNDGMDKFIELSEYFIKYKKIFESILCYNIDDTENEFVILVVGKEEIDIDFYIGIKLEYNILLNDNSWNFFFDKNYENYKNMLTEFSGGGIIN